MGEILTSDLVYGGNMGPDAVANGTMEQPKTVSRGEALPKDYEGPPSKDELRELGVLVDEDQFYRLGGFEPQGGRALPQGLGQSHSSLSQRQAALRAHAEDMDENQAKLNEASEQGRSAEEAMDTKEPKASKADLEEIRKGRVARPELKESAPNAEPTEESAPAEEKK